MSNHKSLTELDLAAHYSSLLEEKRTLWVSFENKTQHWRVGVWVYEVRQKLNLPPPNGFKEWTGVVVGGTDIKSGQKRTSYLQDKVRGDFGDAGLIDLVNENTGRRLASFNLRSQVAQQGKYYRYIQWAIVPKENLGDEAFGWEFEGILEDGTIDKFQGVVLETL
ncbi:hypothetical protein [Shewanella holmiensis]|uniref:Uncharacterized protein n=1 Tax=Shewanella holmiensis TaxID=2952222 RepID=A0A9X2WNF1_9GAMM|nr:hypothetical protein [Shewanella holmiensis]MCT7942404.1 hypothetical protein [Shewanella holmiensis]